MLCKTFNKGKSYLADTIANILKFTGKGIEISLKSEFETQQVINL